MIIEKTGRIIDEFYVIGPPTMPLFLMDGTAPVLFDAGCATLARRYEKDIKAVMGARAPAYLFLTHAHWDHVGSAGYLKSLWPEMRIAGSIRTRDILARPRAIRLIEKLNREAVYSLRKEGLSTEEDIGFESFHLDLVLEDGQQNEPDRDLTVEPIHAPGHTWDLTAYWLPERRILVASEAAGDVDGLGNAQPNFLADYDVYVESIKRLEKLDAEILCIGHRTVFTGSDLQAYLKRALDVAARYLCMVEEFLLEEKGDIDRVVNRIKAHEWDCKPWPKQPEASYLINTRQRVKKIWERERKKEAQAQGPARAG